MGFWSGGATPGSVQAKANSFSGWAGSAPIGVQNDPSYHPAPVPTQPQQQKSSGIDGLVNKIKNLAVGTAKGIAKPFTNLANDFVPTRGSNKQGDVLKGQTAIQNAVKQGKLSAPTVALLKSAGPSQQAAAYTLAAQNPNFKEADLLKQIQKQAVADKAHTITRAGDVAQIASMAAPIGEVGTILKGGAVGAKAAALTATAGAVGGAGAVYSENPGATAKQALTGAGVGAGVGLAIPFVAHVAGAGLKAGAKQVVTKAATDIAPKPYANIADKVVTGTGAAIGKGIGTVASKVPGITKVADKLVQAKDYASTKMVESLHPVFKALGQSEQKGTLPEGSKNYLDLLRGNAAGSARQAKTFVDTNPTVKTFLKSVTDLSTNSKTAQKAFDDYATSTREMQLMDSGQKALNPDRYNKFKEQATTLRAQYGDKIETARQNLVKAHGEVSNLLRGNSLSEQDLAHFQAHDPEYIRTQREVPSYRQEQPFAKGGSATDTSHQKVNKFATQKALSPTATFLDRAYGAHAFINNNELKKQAVTMLKEGGHNIQPLRTTANVTTRREIAQSLKDSKPLRNELVRMVSKHGNEVRGLKSEVNTLNKQGLDSYLKRGPKEDTLAGKLVDPGTKVSPNETKNIIHSLVAEDPAKLNAIRSKLGTRQPKLTTALDSLENYRRQLGQLSEQRSQEFLKARGASDTPAHGSPTVSYWDNGIKNTYKVPHDIAAAINKYNAPQMNGLFNAVKTLNNVFKYGTTQGNPAFAIPNFIKDQMSSSVISESAFRTHNPVNVVRSLATAVLEAGGKKSKDPLWEAFSKGIGSSNLIDVNKNLAKAVKNVRSELNTNRTLPGKVANIRLKSVLKAPFAKTDDFINALENATRYQNYRGTYNLYKAKGATEVQAKNAALLAARRNSVDFSAGGEFGKFLNSFTPYLNAGIQGTRTLGRAVKERPVTTTAKLLIASSPALALTYWNLSDPGRAKLYAATPEYIRKSNFVIVAGNKRFLVPVSPELQAVSNLIRTTVEARFGYEPKSAMQQAGNFINAFSPVNATSPAGVASSLLPPVVKSSIELGTNKDFYSGQQIIPDYIKYANQNPQDQKYAKTSGTTQRIANALGVSPIQVDYFNKANFGNLGGPNATNAIDQATGQSQGTKSIAQSIGQRFGVDSSVNDVKTQFNNIYYPLQQASDFKKRQVTTAVYKSGGAAQASRIADAWNNQVDQSFQKYYQQYGQYADPKYAQMIGKLKISVAMSKKGRPYLK